MKMDVINTEDRIDNYLLGNITPEEKVLFESDMKKNAKLKDEYEIQKEIADSIQRLALREFLTECEKKRTSKHQIQFIIARNTVMKILSHRLLYGKRLALGLASAASAIIVIITGIGYAHISDELQNAAPYIYTATQVAITRDGNDITDMLASAYVYIGENQLKKAESVLLEVNDKLEAILKKPIITDDDKVNHDEALEQVQDSKWYSAIILMKQGKVIKAKKTLVSIVETDGIHSDEAKEILINIYKSHWFNKK